MVMLLILDLANLVAAFYSCKCVGLPGFMVQLCLFPIKVIFICVRMVGKMVSLFSAL